ncbi:HAD family hydrolase [Mycobacterium sp. 21AC1]|uniref:HAD family hydrolase n=1 Tax=[Mycobacterium] appelbergii TaxID=2939269 RepID=UPI0029391569|nr:HAD family hydrolase [Mycobacterium sp. 21AC1]MDV3130135.1 HAD family hydrolase [Mycobacterium sp. 21AC1]
MPAESETPRLLALDVGGVIVETGPADGWAEVFARQLLDGARRSLPDAADLPDSDWVAAELAEGRARHSTWKGADRDGVELDDEQLWALLARPAWGRALLEHIARDRAGLTAALCLTWETRVARPGIGGLLDACDRAGIDVCIVSNTISGRAYRTVLADNGFDGRFAGLAFSDEVGIRKPDPRILLRAVEQAGGDPSTTWYVGDTYRRDVACGHRAGVAKTILMRSGRTEPPPAYGPKPDAIVADPAALLDRITPGRHART